MPTEQIIIGIIILCGVILLFSAALHLMRHIGYKNIDRNAIEVLGQVTFKSYQNGMFDGFLNPENNSGNSNLIGKYIINVEYYDELYNRYICKAEGMNEQSYDMISKKGEAVVRYKKDNPQDAYIVNIEYGMNTIDRIAGLLMIAMILSYHTFFMM